MIPSIEDIVAGVEAGKYTTQQAIAWLNKHVELALGDDLRDHFAGLAMQGTYTNPISATREEKAYIAQHAYAMADAMLKARTA